MVSKPTWNFLSGFFLNGIFAKPFFLLVKPVGVIKWRRRNKCGPKRNRKPSLSTCHWSLNSISSHFHKFDIICLSESYLNSSNSADDETLEISGYNLVHPDHPLNKKRGSVFIHYKNYLPLWIISISYLSECINFETMIGNKICNFITLYRSSSQNQNDFQEFIDNLQINLHKQISTNKS